MGGRTSPGLWCSTRVAPSSITLTECSYLCTQCDHQRYPGVRQAPSERCGGGETAIAQSARGVPRARTPANGASAEARYEDRTAWLLDAAPDAMATLDTRGHI